MPSILIFDSGVGGLSIYQHVKRLRPEADYILVCDNHAFPYGDKSEEELNSRVLTVMSNLVAKYQPDLAVVACNTASTVVLPLLRDKLAIPVVGVVPAIKPAVALTKTKTIGLLATPGTIRRRYTEDLIEKFASNCTIVKVGSLKLVELCEAKLYSNELEVDLMKRELEPILDEPRCDALVLACTHFPLIKDDISELFRSSGRNISLVDSGEGIARRVDYLLGNLDSNSGEIQQFKSSLKRIAVFTQDIDSKSAFVARLASDYGLEYGGTMGTGCH